MPMGLDILQEVILRNSSVFNKLGIILYKLYNSGGNQFIFRSFIWLAIVLEGIFLLGTQPNIRNVYRICF